MHERKESQPEQAVLESDKAACLKKLKRYVKEFKKKAASATLRNYLANDPYFEKCILGDASIQYSDFKDIFDACIDNNKGLAVFTYALMLSPLFLEQIKKFSPEEKEALEEKLKLAFNDSRNMNPYYLYCYIVKDESIGYVMPEVIGYLKYGIKKGKSYSNEFLSAFIERHVVRDEPKKRVKSEKKADVSDHQPKRKRKLSVKHADEDYVPIKKASAKPTKKSKLKKKKKAKIEQQDLSTSDDHLLDQSLIELAKEGEFEEIERRLDAGEIKPSDVDYVINDPTDSHDGKNIFSFISYHEQWDLFDKFINNKLVGIRHLYAFPRNVDDEYYGTTNAWQIFSYASIDRPTFKKAKQWSTKVALEELSLNPVFEDKAIPLAIRIDDAYRDLDDWAAVQYLSNIMIKAGSNLLPFLIVKTSDRLPLTPLQMLIEREQWEILRLIIINSESINSAIFAFKVRDKMNNEVDALQFIKDYAPTLGTYLETKMVTTISLRSHPVSISLSSLRHSTHFSSSSSGLKTPGTPVSPVTPLTPLDSSSVSSGDRLPPLRITRSSSK